MTRDEVGALALTAISDTPATGWSNEWLMRFAELVAATERERCAQVAESYEPRCDICPSGVANAIRARGKSVFDRVTT